MSNVVNHGIKIELDKKQYNAIVAAMNNINGRSAEFVISHGSNTAAKKIQKLLSNQVKGVYQAPWAAGVYGRSSITKGNVRNVGAVIHFKSELPDITKFKYHPASTPTIFAKNPPYKLHKLQVRKSPGSKERITIYRMLGPQRKYNVSISQLKGSTRHLQNAFVTQFDSGHIAVGFRNKQGTTRKKYNGRLPITKVLGSSDMIMASNEKTYGAVEQGIEQIVLNEVMAQFNKAMSKVTS